ncbi:MAG: thioredoxin family protein [Thermogemmata sp.]
MRILHRPLWLSVTLGLLIALPSSAWPQWFRNTTEVVRWETDYNAARQKAAEKGLPLFVIIGTEHCFYCRKLEHGPLREASIVAYLQRHFVPLKIDAQREAELARALRVQVYPTIVLAGPDGKIHAFIEGYQDSQRLEEHCKRTLLAVHTPQGSARDFEQASQAISSGDYPRAIALLRQISREARDQPVAQKARQLLEQIEKQAAQKQQQAQAFLAQGQTREALEVLSEVVRRYAGTSAADSAAEQMQRLTARTEVQQQLHQRSAQELLAAAREDFRRQQYYDCLLKCEQLQSGFPGQPEAQEARRLAAEIKKHPQYLSRACEQLQQRTVQLSLDLAEAWLAQGQTAEAIACYERVVRLAPGSPQAQAASTALNRLKTQGTGTPAGGTPTGMVRP